MGFSNMIIAAARSIPKSTITQSIPSFTYSSCSTTNMWWLKNCWSFSLTKLIEICSKPLYSKISKPAMSNTAQKFAFFRVASIRVSLLFNEPSEDTIEDGSGNTSNSSSGLFTSLTLGDPFSSDLDTGFAESLDHHCGIDTKGSSNLSWESVGTDFFTFGLVITTLCFEFNSTTGHDTSSKSIASKFLILAESKNVEGILGVFKLFIVIDRGNSSFSLGHIDVVIDISADMAEILETTSNTITVGLDELVEDVV